MLLIIELLMINQPLTGWTVKHFVSPEQYIVLLRRQIHETPLAHASEHVNDRQAVSTISKDVVFPDYCAVQLLASLEGGLGHRQA